MRLSIHSAQNHTSFRHKEARFRLPPNTPLELTALRVERDRVDFESWNQPDRFPDLSARRSSAAGHYALWSIGIAGETRREVAYEY
jgi:hypothetical protein